MSYFALFCLVIHLTFDRTIMFITNTMFVGLSWSKSHSVKWGQSYLKLEVSFTQYLLTWAELKLEYIQVILGYVCSTYWVMSEYQKFSWPWDSCGNQMMFKILNSVAPQVNCAKMAKQRKLVWSIGYTGLVSVWVLTTSGSSCNIFQTGFNVVR